MSFQTPSVPDPGLADAVARVAASVVALASHRHGNASGFIWQPGIVVTTAAAVWRASKVRVVLPGGEHVEGAVRGLDPSTDIAVVTIGQTSLAPVARREQASARVGDFVFAVGREPGGAVHASFGHIGKAGGEWRTWRGGRVDSLIRLDGGLYPGLHGAPVADASGAVLGLASAMLSRHHGVVLDTVTVERVVGQLLEHGRVARGYLGIAAQSVELAAELAASGNGLLITSVARDAPAARAGLMVGDIITGAAGQGVTSMEALRDLLAGHVGKPLPLALLRGGQPLELAVEVGERPQHGRCG